MRVGVDEAGIDDGSRKLQHLRAGSLPPGLGFIADEGDLPLHGENGGASGRGVPRRVNGGTGQNKRGVIRERRRGHERTSEQKEDREGSHDARFSQSRARPSPGLSYSRG